MRFTLRACYALTPAALLISCGQEPSQTSKQEMPVEAVRTCESIRGEVVRLSEKNPVQIVKIYEPKTVKSEPRKVSCSGRAVSSNRLEGTLYYRAFRDSEGQWMIEYNDNPLD